MNVNDQRHVFIAHDGREYFRDPRLGTDEEIARGSDRNAQVRKAGFPVVREDQGWPSTTVTMDLASFESSGPEENDDRRRSASILLYIAAPAGWAALPLHIEMLEVTEEEDGDQTPLVFEDIYASLGGLYDSRLQTLDIGGRHYVVYAFPHGQ